MGPDLILTHVLPDHLNQEQRAQQGLPQMLGTSMRLTEGCTALNEAWRRPGHAPLTSLKGKHC